MSRTNPDKAVAALIPAPIKIRGGLSVRPLTLGMYAVLERFKSPLVTGRTDVDTLELLPSLYALTHEPADVLDGSNVLFKALEWADTVPPDIIAEIHAAALTQVKTLLDVVPDNGSKKKEEEGNGWIAALAYWAASEFGLTYAAIMWDTPAAFVALMKRQADFAAGKRNVIHLSEIEKIDNGILGNGDVAD